MFEYSKSSKVIACWSSTGKKQNVLNKSERELLVRESKVKRRVIRTCDSSSNETCHSKTH